MKIEVLACDMCGKRSDEAIDVRTASFRHGTKKLSGDLCGSCCDKVVKMIGFKPLSRGRHHIIVTPIGEIG